MCSSDLERFPEMGPSFVRQPRRPMLEAWMHMWGQMMPKRGDTFFPARISHDSLDLLASVGGLHRFIMVPCPYVGLDWRGFPNTLFTPDEMPYDRGNIIVLFIFILTFSLTWFYCVMKLSNYCCVIVYILQALALLMARRCRNHHMI